MAEKTVDNLNIQISSDAKRAVNALNTLSGSLKSVGQNFQNDISIMRKFSKEIGTMDAAIRSLGKTKIEIPAMKELKGVFKAFGSMDGDSAAKAADGLNRVAESMALLGRTNFNESGINKTVNSLNRLFKIDTSQFDFDGFEKVISSITVLGNMPDTSNSVNRFVSSIARLANAGEKTGQSASGLAELGKQLKEVTKTFSKMKGVAPEVNEFVSAIARLANAGGKTGQTAASLENLARETLKFFEAMKNAPRISENTIRMTQALAQLATAGGRVGTATNTVTSSFNRLSAIGGKTLSAIKKVASGVASAFKKIGSSSNHVKTAQFNLLSLAKTAIAFRLGYGLVNFGKQAFELGSAITEVENVVDVSFGSMADKAYEFASMATEQFGLSELAAKQYAGTMMAMLNSSGVAQDAAAEMSIGLAGLAGDLASFYNIKTDEAFYKLRAAMAGEIEPLRQLGINMTVVNLEAYAMSQGITKSYQAMSQAEQQMLRYNYIMSVTGAQQGDYQRTLGTFANQWRLLTLNVQQFAATIGQGLIAAVLPAIQAINALFSVLQKAATAFRDFMYVLTGYKPQGSGGVVNDLAGIGDAATDLGDLGNSGGDAASGLDDATSSAQDLKKALSVLDFDELNQLSDSSSADVSTPSGSGGSGGTGIGGIDSGIGDLGNVTDALAKSELPAAINEWAERIRKAFLDHDWDKLGEEIAWGLNKGLQYVYDAINWKNVGPKITAFTTAFTKTLNSLVESFDWDLLGRTIGSGINTIVNTLNQLIEGFDFTNLGNKIAEGLRGAISEIQWKNLGNLLGNYFMISWDMLSGFVQEMSKKDGAGITGWDELGKSLGEAVNGIFEKINFGEIGTTLSTGINGIFETLKGFTLTINWDSIAVNIYTGLNNMISGIDWKSAGESLSLFVTELLDTFNKVVQKTDWEELGESIGEFLLEIDFLKIGKKVGKAIWNAINAGLKSFKKLFDTAPVEAAILSLVTVTKLLNTKSIQNFIKAIKSGASNVITFGKALSGNTIALQSLQTNFPKTAKAVNVLKDSFWALRTGIADGNWLTGIGLAFENIRNNLTNTQKGVITTVAAFAEFSVVKDSISDIVTGSGSLVTNIVKIGSVAAVAGTAMYTALGPAGIAIAAVTGLVAALSGVKDAIEEIDAQKAGEDIRAALSNPGGVPVEDLTQNVVNSMETISDSFSLISEKSGELETAKKNVSDTVFEIDKVKTSLEAGVISAEEAVPKLSDLYGQLADAIITKLGSAGDVLLATFGSDGFAAQAFEEGGLKAEKATQRTVKAMDSQEKAIYELRDEITRLSETDPTNPRLAEAQAELFALASEGSEAEKALEKLRLKTTEEKLDWSNYLDKDGLDTRVLEADLKKLSDSVTDTRNIATKNFEEIVLAFQDLGDESLYEDARNALPGALNYMNEQTALMAQNLTNTLQTDLLGGIETEIKNAQERWANMNPLEKAFQREDEYIYQALENYRKNYIDPVSTEIETKFNELGINGAGWASSTAKEIIDNLFNTTETYSAMGTPGTTEILKENYESIINQALAEAPGIAHQKGALVPQEYGAGIGEGSLMLGETLSSATISKINSILPEGSRLAFENGQWTIQQYTSGMSQNGEGTDLAISAATIDKISAILPEGVTIAYNNGTQTIEGYKSGLNDTGDTVFDSLKRVFLDGINLDKELESKYSGYAALSVKGYNEKIEELKKDTKDTMDGLVNDSIKFPMTSGLDMHSPSRVFEGYGENIIGGLNRGIDKKSGEPTSRIKDIGSSLMDTISDTISNLSRKFSEGEDSAHSSANSIQDAFSNLYIPLPHVNWDWNYVSVGDWEIPIPDFSIDWYKTGGLFTRATIAGIGEAGNEAVLPLENKRTMGMIADSILANASVGMDERILTEAVARGVAMAMMNNNQNQPPINVYATLYTEDNEVLARAVQKGQDSIDYRFNPSIAF